MAEKLCPRLVGECRQARVGVITRVTLSVCSGTVLMERFSETPSSQRSSPLGFARALDVPARAEGKEVERSAVMAEIAQSSRRGHIGSGRV